MPFSAWKVFAVALLCQFGSLAASAAAAPVRPSVAALPLTFERNDGQADPRFHFLARHAGADVFFGESGIEFAMPAQDRTARLTLRFPGANAQAQLLGESPQAGRVNYLRGAHAADWVVGVPTFAGVRYRDLYAGIDLVFHQAGGDGQRNLEHDFLVAPGADPARITLALDSAARLTLLPGSDLDVRFGAAQGAAHMVLKKPVAWQGPEGERRAVEVGFRLVDEHTIAFNTGAYDRSQALTIDPVLHFSTYLDGTGNDSVSAVKTDAAGNVYVVGSTTSTDFPLKNPEQSTCATNSGPPCSSAFVTKLDSSGHSLIFSTYLGGMADAEPQDLAIAPDGSVIVTGTALAPGFPQVGKLAKTYSSYTDSFNFLLSLSRDGSSLRYSGFLGITSALPPNPSRATDVAVDAEGAAYLTGTTDDTNFPVTPGAYGGAVPGYPANTLFVAKVAADGGIVYAATIPGNAPVDIQTTNNAFTNGGIQIDAQGEAVVVGSGGPGLPATSGSLSPGYPNSTADAQFATAGFAFKLNASGSTLLFATYLPGTDTANGLALDPSGNPYIAGYTEETTLPVSPNAYSTATETGCTCSGYVLKLSVDGTKALAATYLGNSKSNAAPPVTLSDIALDGSGNVAVAGKAGSLLFPTRNPVLSAGYGAQGAVLAELSPDLSSLLFGSYFNAADEPAQLKGLTVDPQNRMVVTGETVSSIFPTTVGSFQSVPPPGTPDSPASGGGIFVASIDPSIAAPSLCFSTQTVQFGLVLVNTSQQSTVTITNCGDAPLNVETLGSSDPTVTAQHTCTGIAPGGECQVELTYTPVNTNVARGTLSISGNMGASPQRINFSGSGGYPDVYVPPSVDFGDQLVGQKSGGELTFENDGNVSFTVTSATATGDFQVVQNQCATPVPPIGQVLPPSSCQIVLAFAPTAGGTRTGTLTLVDNLQSGTQTVALTGNALTSATIPSITVIPATLRTPTGATLTVIGNNFFPTSVVSWNGSARTTTYLNERALTAQLSAADVAQLGEAPVTVSTPAPGGGVTPSTLGLLYDRIDNIQINHAVFDPHAQLLYATVSQSLPGLGYTYSNSVVAFDPVSQKVVKTLLTGNTPDAIAVSDDGTLLYVGLDATSSLAQIGLPSGAVNFTISLGSNSTGPLIAEAIAAVPGAAHSFILSRRVANCTPCGAGIQVYDDAVPRPTMTGNGTDGDDVLQFVSDPTIFYSTQLYVGPPTLLEYKIDAVGLSLAKTGARDSGQDGVMGTDGRLLYFGTGQVVDPSTLTVKSDFGLVGDAFHVDAPNSRIYFVNEDSPYSGLPNNTLMLAAADLNTQQTLNQIGFPELSLLPTGVERFSTNGLLIYGPSELLVMRTGLTGVSATLPPAAALPAATLSPASLTFDSQALGTPSAAQTVTLTSAGTSNLTIASIQTSAGFAETDNCGGQTLPPATGCQIQVTFTPTVAGPATGTLTVTDNAADSPQTMALSGTGEAPPLAITAPPGGSTTATVAAGQPAIYNLAMAAGPGFSGPVTLACSGAPANASCTLDPASLTLAAGASASFTVTVKTAAHTVAHTSTQIAPRSAPGDPRTRYAGASLLSLTAMFALFRLRRRAWSLGLGLCLLIACTLAVGGCGGGVSDRSTPAPASAALTAPGTYTLTVTASAATASLTQKLTLVVQ